MSKTVLGVFEDINQAERAVEELKRRGFDKKEISIVAKDQNKGDSGGRGGGGMFAGTEVSDGIATGGAIGGAAGLLAGVGALAVPGIGPILAVGPIAAALSGAVTGGVAGGLIDWGIPEDTGRRYEEFIKAGKVAALVKADDDKVQEAADIFRQHGAHDVESH